MGVPGSANLLLLGGERGYQIERSLRFSSGDSSYLNRTYSGACLDAKLMTISVWVKRGKLTTAGQQPIFSSYSAVRFGGDLTWTAADKIQFRPGGNGDGASNQYSISTDAVFRDPSAWYHIVIQYDSTQATSTNRQKIYVNGVQQTVTGNYPTQNYLHTYAFNNANNQIGAYTSYGSDYLDSYLTEFHFIDGQALTPSSFGETDTITGVWKPKRYTGTYGTNGFYLNFKDNSNTTATTLGKDYSGNGNNWTPNNFSAAIGSSSWSFGTQRENDYREGTIISGITGFTSASFSGTYNWGGNTGGSLSNYMALRDSSNTVIASTSVSGASGSWSLSATGLSTSTTYHLFISASSSGGSFMERNSYGSFTTSYGGRASDTDSFIDTPTPYADGGNGRGNYCTLNPLDSTATLSNGNLTQTATAERSSRSTFQIPSTGLWYAEATATSTTNGSTISCGFGLAAASVSLTANPYSLASAWNLYSSNAAYINRNGTPSSSLGFTLTAGDVVQIAVDPANNRAWIGRNNTWYDSGTGTTGDPAGGTNPTVSSLPAGLFVFANTFNQTWDVNFGQRAFAYTPPSGFLALNTNSLPEPSIKKPSSYMDTLLWSGNSTANRSISGLNFNPDLVWLKARSATSSNALFDAVRGGGTGKDLVSDSTAAEGSISAYGYLTTFNSDGFNLTGGTNPSNPYGAVNETGRTYVAWCWDESATPGFDIVTYTGNGTARTIAHSLGVAPSMIIFKNRDVGTTDWAVYFKLLVETNSANYVKLNSTGAVQTSPSPWNGTLATSSVFSVGTWDSVNGNGNGMVAYLWSEVAGFSKFGSYTGNGSSDGPFVFCGFRPRFIMIKNSTNSGVGYSWFMYDSARNTFNITTESLLADSSSATYTDPVMYIDVLSNGFKIKGTAIGVNNSSATMVFAAFAESPFKYSLAR